MCNGFLGAFESVQFCRKSRVPDGGRDKIKPVHRLESLTQQVGPIEVSLKVVRSVTRSVSALVTSARHCVTECVRGPLRPPQAIENASLTTVCVCVRPSIPNPSPLHVREKGR